MFFMQPTHSISLTDSFDLKILPWKLESMRRTDPLGSWRMTQLTAAL